MVSLPDKGGTLPRTSFLVERLIPRNVATSLLPRCPRQVSSIPNSGRIAASQRTDAVPEAALVGRLLNDAYVPNNDAPTFGETNPSLRHAPYLTGCSTAMEKG